MPGSLAGLMPARVIHQDLARQVCRRPEEVRPPVPTRVLLIDQPQVSLVYQRGGLRRVVGAFVRQVGGSQLAQFGVNKRSELFQGLLVNPRPLPQDLRDRVAGRHDTCPVDAWLAAGRLIVARLLSRRLTLSVV